jgi:3alpha(or 20beta)-hydroxysteroid dehydrogenase
MAAAIPLRRLAKPEEVAATVIHLLSSASAFTTGAEVVIDGGLVAG